MMIKTLMAISALSVAAFSAPAFAADDSMTVNLGGKSVAAKYAAVVHAARQVCRPENGADIYTVFMTDNCVKDTVSAAIDKAADPALSKFVADRDALLLTLASN